MSLQLGQGHGYTLTLIMRVVAPMRPADWPLVRLLQGQSAQTQTVTPAALSIASPAFYDGATTHLSGRPRCQRVLGVTGRAAFFVNPIITDDE